MGRQLPRSKRTKHVHTNQHKHLKRKGPVPCDRFWTLLHKQWPRSRSGRRLSTRGGGGGGGGGWTDGAKASTKMMVETRKLKELDTRSRILTFPRKKARRKPGMSVSEVSTEKRQKLVMKKWMGTGNGEKQNEEPEITILKEIKMDLISVTVSTKETEEKNPEKNEKENDAIYQV